MYDNVNKGSSTKGAYHTAVLHGEDGKVQDQPTAYVFFNVDGSNQTTRRAVDTAVEEQPGRHT